MTATIWNPKNYLFPEFEFPVTSLSNGFGGKLDLSNRTPAIKIPNPIESEHALCKEICYEDMWLMKFDECKCDQPFDNLLTCSLKTGAFSHPIYDQHSFISSLKIIRIFLEGNQVKYTFQFMNPLYIPCNCSQYELSRFPPKPFVRLATWHSKTGRRYTLRGSLTETTMRLPLRT